MQVKERASKAEPTVKQVKILRDVDKAGEAKAKSAKSKGFAFVELTDHEHALCALRQLNNNPVPFGALLAHSPLPLCYRLQDVECSAPVMPSAYLCFLDRLLYGEFD